MPSYRIWRLKENQIQQFRWAPHTIGATNIKPKDYEEKEVIDAEGAYALWAELKDSPNALRVGDVLESAAGELRIYKYVGFEEARWVLPEVKSGLEAQPLAITTPQQAPPAAG
ncbi:MAG: hypothetical protein LLG20_04465 [Acidobacteriales bacterium]|nr:hypothetical protein [Terriglobales bacterium]